MLLEAYGKPPVPDSIPISGADHALHGVSGQPGVFTDAIPDSPVSALPAPVEAPSRPRIGQFAALLALPAGIAAYFGWRRMRKRPKSEPPAVPAANGIREPISADVAVPVSDLEPVYPALSLGVSDVLV